MDLNVEQEQIEIEYRCLNVYRPQRGKKAVGNIPLLPRENTQRPNPICFPIS